MALFLWQRTLFCLQKSLSPNLPEDLAISFYLQSHKLIFAVYQLTNIQGTMKFDSCHAEFSVPWLNEVLVLFTVGLQLCQQLKDKVSLVCSIYLFHFMENDSFFFVWSLLWKVFFNDLENGLLLQNFQLTSKAASGDFRDFIILRKQ